MQIDINKIATLANLPLTEEEKRLFQPQLEQIVGFVEKLNEVDTDGIEPTYQVTGKTNELREDVPQLPLTTAQTVQNAPETKDSYILTKGVFERA